MYIYVVLFGLEQIHSHETFQVTHIWKKHLRYIHLDLQKYKQFKVPPLIPNPFQDDIIDDVEDFVAAAEILKERGAYKIYIMATHGLLSAEAPRLIEESAIDEVKSFPVLIH